MNDTIKSNAPAQTLEATPSSIAPAESEDPIRFNWRTNAALFAATVVSVFFVGRLWTGREGDSEWQLWLGAWRFAVPLLAILVAHEFGHYIAARLHRVPASLPYFLPLPLLNPFGTLGAIIVMPRRIRTRSALLDIGAAGPLAGMALAIPLMIYGLSLSPLEPRGVLETGYIQEGQSILYWALKYLVFGPIPADHDVYLHPTALAAWAGFFLTFLNMLPFSQLDGGHVAYALMGRRQNRLAPWLLVVPPVLVIYNFWIYVRPIVDRGMSQGFDTLTWSSWAPVSSVTLWIMLGILLLVLRRLAGADHPPVDDERLSPARRTVAIVTLALFVLLFMPSPMVSF
jgi:membrane-associated protease RseP (regulator of RpoE activity)